MNYNEVLTKYADTINRIKENLGRIENPDRDYQALFAEYCQNPKNRQLGKLLQEGEEEFEQTGTIDEEVWQARLDKWDAARKRKPSGKAKKQVAPVASYQDLKNKRQQLEKELQQVDEQLQKAKFNEFDNAVKTLLRDNVTKDELINRINDLAK